MQEKQRLLEKRVLQSLTAFPVVYIAGPRQSGKTTLAQRITATQHPAQYITFDDIVMRSSAKRDADAFLRALDGPVVLDEIQMVPELFRPLKIRVDEHRARKDGGRGQFLLTGSASVMALPKLSDALVGRMVLHTLLPFAMQEISQATDTAFIDRAFSADWQIKRIEEDSITQAMLSASFPELSSLSDSALRHEWCNGYINTILQRDVSALLEVEKIAMLPDILRLLASRTGGLLNETALSRVTGLNHLTTKRYRLLLESLFLIQPVPAWTRNIGKRLIKSPKIYINDINLLAYLLNIDVMNIPQTNPMLFGQLLENFVAIEIAKQLTFSNTRATLYHYRTTTGQEIDFLLEGPQNHLVGLEIKARRTISHKDFHHLEALKQDIGEQFLRGFVLYPGTQIIPFGKDMWAIPITALWRT